MVNEGGKDMNKDQIKEKDKNNMVILKSFLNEHKRSISKLTKKEIDEIVAKIKHS